MASQTDDFNKIKLYIESEQGNQPLLLSWDTALPLRALIAEVCSQWSIKNPESFALKTSSSTQEFYLTDEARRELKSGQLLHMTASPKKMAEEVKQLLNTQTEEAKEECFELLQLLSKDPLFVTSFLSTDGIHFLMEAIQKEIMNYNPEAHPMKTIDGLLESFQDIMEQSMVSWTIIQPEYIINLCEFLNKQKEPQLQTKVLTLLENAIFNSEKLYLPIFESLSTETLTSLTSDKSPSVQLATLSFINAMLGKGNTMEYLQLLKKQRILQGIGSHVIGRHPQVKPEVAHQLYVCQNLSLGVLEKRATSRFIDHYDTSYKHLVYLVNSLHIQTPDTANKNIEDEFVKLGFLNEDPTEDFNDVPPGLLALDCMVYFAQSQPENFTRQVLRKLEFQCPFGHTSIFLTKMMYSLLKVGEPVSDISTDYIPMFFSNQNFFEEFFCINIQLLFKTWREMRATPIDFEKVMSVVQKQIDMVMRDPEVSSLDSYRRKIMQLNYSQILKQLDIEKEHQDANIFKAKPVMELRDRLQPQILDLIKRQRLNQLVKGESFSDPKRKKTIFCRLTQNHKFLHYGEVEGNKVPSIEELEKKIQVNQMKELLLGKDIVFKSKNKTESHALGIVFSGGEDKRLELLATDERKFCVWIDGIRILLGQQPDSDLAISDMETLLNMDMKIHLLAIENIPIPDYPPVIPPNPPNLDFCTTPDL
ncbi:Engulfment and cell motility protein 1 [Oopsacas minuta]|uniref:Engulfment and cell motility protein 1 n=1 Tax=Oopsacas minuta TaxID=111878 RepID=A0AAV7K5N5_9METZ|nr:Engulfment and cell motility protein 1 [Oopsacas minuta]